ncbi:hypothetical protein APHAL10511_000875 [Amanita phalloides]|nr:hypothetical protein APHAL10511_000875 [Amanita phalloides]
MTEETTSLEKLTAVECILKTMVYMPLKPNDDGENLNTVMDLVTKTKEKKEAPYPQDNQVIHPVHHGLLHQSVIHHLQNKNVSFAIIGIQYAIVEALADMMCLSAAQRET